MPRVEVSPLVYEVLEWWRRDCLRGGGALVGDDALWSSEHFAELRRAFNEQPDESSDSFLQKLGRQLAEASDEAVHLFAEVLYIHLLPARDITGDTKRRNLDAVANIGTAPWVLDEQLDAALDQGLANTGVAYKSYRPHQLWLLIDAFESLLSHDDREHLLDDPWAFKNLLFAIAQEAAYSQRNLLLHMVHDDTFEPTASREHERQIVEALGEDGDPDDVDRALYAIRERLGETAGDGLGFYSASMRRRWDPQARRAWDALTRFADVVLTWGGFDETERDYKLEFAERTGLASSGAPVDVERVVGALRDANLVDFRVVDDFATWALEDPGRAADAIEVLLADGAAIEEKVDGFAARIEAAVSTRGAVCSLAGALLLASAPERWAAYRTRTVRSIREALDLQPSDPPATHGEEYAAWIEVLEAAAEQLRVRGVPCRDRLEVQSLLWVVATRPLDEEPFAPLPEDDRSALQAWRGDTEPSTVDGTEQRRRGRRLDSLVEQLRQTGKLPQLDDEAWASAAGEAIRGALGRLDETGDIAAFAAWLRGSDLVLDHTTQGAHVTYLSSLVNQTSDPERTARLLHRAFSLRDGAPDWDATVELEEHARETGTPNGPAAGMTVLVASAVWALQDRTLPPYYASTEDLLQRCGWVTGSGPYVERYRRLRLQLELADEPVWWANSACAAVTNGTFLGLDPTLVERCGENAGWLDEQVASAAVLSGRNSAQLAGELAALGNGLQGDVAGALRHDVTVHTSSSAPSRSGLHRADGYVSWRLGGTDAPDLRVWVTADGVAVGVHPRVAQADRATAAALAVEAAPDLQLVEVAFATDAPRKVAPKPLSTTEREFLVGRWLPDDTALGRRDLRDDVLAVAQAASATLTAWIREFGGTVLPQPEDDPLSAAVDAFRQEREYPSASDRTAEQRRATFADLLTEEALSDFGPDQLRDVLNSHAYGYTGAQSILNKTLRDADGPELTRIGDAVAALLHGDGPVHARIDAILDEARDKVRGLGESGVWKLLAVTRPDECIPVFPFGGDMGKAAFLDLLGLDRPAGDATAGQRHVAANDALRDRLAPFFGDDTHGMREFLYWWRSWEERGAEDVDHLAEAATDLHVSRTYLDELVGLLRDKRQIILYGPPGTGKTYLARRLARALVADDHTRHELVQFHPSYTYEDFFEGYRPVVDADGQMSYELRPGPLARLVDKASAASGADHVLVIDEINRANLAKVFGELLYLLEYRGPQHTIATQYRPEGGFTLPKRLFVIGTMNTADRSIALIDAAMRRRFHFVPFFPNEGEMGGLLRRWLTTHDEASLWIVDLLEQVNDRLRDHLGGPHLQIGPSHFLVDDLSEERVRRIWEYSVHPYIEEQLFGQEEVIAEYRFDEVLRRHRAAVAPPGESQTDEEEAADDA